MVRTQSAVHIWVAVCTKAVVVCRLVVDILVEVYRQVVVVSRLASVLVDTQVGALAVHHLAWQTEVIVLRSGFVKTEVGRIEIDAHHDNRRDNRRDDRVCVAP